MPGLDGNASEGAEKDFVGWAEAVEVRRFTQFLLVLEGNTDLVQFGPDLGMVWRKGDETREGNGSILVTAFLDEPSRRLGEENHADCEDKTPNELEGDGKLP